MPEIEARITARVFAAVNHPERGPAVRAVLDATSPGWSDLSQIGIFARAQELLRQGHTYLDKNGDGVACEPLR